MDETVTRHCGIRVSTCVFSVCLRVCVSACVFVFVCVCVCVSIYVYMCICVCVSDANGWWVEDRGTLKGH